MRTLTGRAIGLVLAVSLLAPAAAAGQLALEGRLGATMPVGDLSDLDQTAGLAFSAEIQYNVKRNLTLYGGLGHHRFTCDGCDDPYSTTGLVGGAKLILGADGGALPWIRGGLMVHRPSVDGDAGDWGVGLDSGVGIDWSVAPRIYLVPALRFNTYTSGNVGLSYFTIDLGVHLHLGR